MKNIQSMSVGVNNTDSIMLKALPAISLKEVNHFSTDTIVNDEENFRLQLSEDENGDDAGTKQKSDTKSSVPTSAQDAEEDILNKYDVDGVTCENVDDKLEYQLLNGLEDDEANKTNSETTKGECEADSVNEDKVVDRIDKTSVNSDEDKCDSVVHDPNEATSNEKEQQAEEKQIETNMTEKASEEIIKDQIMDTEGLLQIVDKNDDDVNDKDSCNGNSPRSIDKGESEDNEVDMETEKMDDDAVEDAEPDKNLDKDEDGVDIEEEEPFRSDFDSELDKEYEDIVKSRDLENKEKDDETDGCGDACKPEEDSANDVVSDKDILEVGNDKLGDPEKENSSADVTKDVQDELVANEASNSKSTKRTLGDSDKASNAKKLKLQNKTFTPIPNEQPTIPIQTDDSNNVTSVPKFTTLNAVSEYMRNKSLTKLSRNDLEQICLLKMCEAICHKSEIGELRHQLGVQEQMMDMWRKEALQLTKQARDLEIVNKRLLHEVRLKNERDKPLIPVKITRSVGLQVRSDSNVIGNMMGKRRLTKPQTPTTPQPAVITPSKQNKFVPQKPNSLNKSITLANKIPVFNKVIPLVNKGTPPINKGTSPVNKSTPPVNKGTPTVVNKSVLSSINKGVPVMQRKALQNSTSPSSANNSTAIVLTSQNVTSAANKTTPTTLPSTTNTNKNQNAIARPAPKTASPKIASPKTASPKTVIDLTDDDDKKSTTTVVITSTAAPSTQSVRMVSTQMKTTAATLVQSNSNPTRIMYLYNSDQPKNGPQKVMLLNSSQANSIIASVSNGSPVTVSSSPLRSNLTTPAVKIASPATMIKTASTITTPKSSLKHPAPLPSAPQSQLCIVARQPIPPKPHLSIRRSENGIVLSWKMPYNLDNYEPIASYQLYAYQEIPAPPASELWRKVGDVKALALPMACTLTQFADGNKYYFAVRAVDVQKRMGPFSDPQEIHL